MKTSTNFIFMLKGNVVSTLAFFLFCLYYKGRGRRCAFNYKLQVHIMIPPLNSEKQMVMFPLYPLPGITRLDNTQVTSRVINGITTNH